MLREPENKSAVSFFDGQNLFHHAKAACGHNHPNFDPQKLSDAVCGANGWTNRGVRFYTGIPAAERSPMWHGYWNNRLLAMKRSGIVVTSRTLHYRTESVELSDGSSQDVYVAREKGIDLRLGLDAVRLARLGKLDVIIIFSQDQDLVEVAREVRGVSRSERRWLKVVSAFPSGSRATASRGIDKTDWFRMDEDFYNACLDSRDYRPVQ